MEQRYPTGPVPSNPGRDWLRALPQTVDEIASDWALELGEPYTGGQCAWAVPARDAAGSELVLKIGWRHPEAEHEADALLHWDGDGAVRCLRTRRLEDSDALLLERCVPGTPLNAVLPEPEQDVVIAGLLRRLWVARALPGQHPFESLQTMCELWADEFEQDFEADPQGLDPGLVRLALGLLRELPATYAGREVLLCTDLHAGNVLAARREPWLAIDPKPFVGDPAYDAAQHMLNCDARLAADPVALAGRMAELLEVDRERVRLWLLARCIQEGRHDHGLGEPARRLASTIP